MTATHLESRLVERFRKTIGEGVESASEFIVVGAPLDFTDYKFRAGQIKGMKDALAIMEDLFRKLSEDR